MEDNYIGYWVNEQAQEWGLSLNLFKPYALLYPSCWNYKQAISHFTGRQTSSRDGADQCHDEILSATDDHKKFRRQDSSCTLLPRSFCMAIIYARDKSVQQQQCRLTVVNSESNFLGFQVINDEVVLLLDVADDTEALATPHRKAESGGTSINENEQVLREQLVIRVLELENHIWDTRVRHACDVEAHVQAIRRTIHHGVLDERLVGLRKNAEHHHVNNFIFNK